MNTLDAILSRKSTRAYTGERIPQEALETILKAAFASPVAMAQYEALHITIIESEDLIKEINELAAKMFFAKMGIKKDTDFGAKTMVMISITPSVLSHEMECINAGIVIENMVLAATDMGIDSVILGGAPAIVSQNPDVMQKLGIPEGFSPVLGALFGYAVEDAPAKVHKISVNRV